MGMIREIKIKEGYVTITFAPTSPFCPLLTFLVEEIKKSVSSLPGVTKVEVKVEF